MSSLSVDVVIIGGGIAGLWTLAESVTKGHSAILFEADTLGGGQTLASQGIIHGGSKYALSGTKTGATRSISSMPAIWSEAKLGRHSVDLQEATILSDHQYLIPSKGIDTKLLSFLGSKTMSSHTQSVRTDLLTSDYQLPGISKTLFQLNEMVFDTKSIVETLFKQFKHCIYQLRITDELITKLENRSYEITIGNEEKLQCKHLILCCGEGFNQLNFDKPVMQTRPLHMVFAKGENLPRIYVHFIGRSNKPLLTITSHPCKDGSIVWYLGGGLAENGINKNKTEQIEACKNLLENLLPEIIKSKNMVFNTFKINRAEPLQKGLKRPDDAFVHHQGNLHIAWPTKLALAPRLSEKLLEKIPAKSEKAETPELELTKPELASYPWEKTND